MFLVKLWVVVARGDVVDAVKVVQDGQEGPRRQVLLQYSPEEPKVPLDAFPQLLCRRATVRLQ